ncbi:MAG: diaminopimelate decarboxylase [candidate division Zixibacteria bacterium]|nr:diaminopimelate decarboxylase [candidate division Zixibacteria bacterium]
MSGKHSPQNPEHYLERIADVEMTAVMSKAINEGIITEEDTAVFFYDLSRLKARIDNLITLFPDSTLHAVAVKANPLISILKYLEKLNVGAEAASLPELYLAEKCGYRPERIAFDSPVKTWEEIEYALKLGVHINIDSFEELKRISTLLKSVNSRSTMGIRINPQVGAGTIELTSVADEYSKFGIPIKQFRSDLKQAYLENEWLTGVHLHVGSQGCPPELLIDGIAIVLDFAEEVNSELQKQGSGRRIDIFDIGGGLPTPYSANDNIINMSDYYKMLRSRLPKLFDGRYRLITEFGRYIHANVCWAVSRIEYLKQSENLQTAMIHLGAECFTRECYHPEIWYHDMSVVNTTGALKKAHPKKSVIAGPLCFAGDIIAKNIELPAMESGDYLIIHDSGAYILSMWSRYNSRQMPKVIGYYGEDFEFVILKARESPETVYRFWDDS